MSTTKYFFLMTFLIFHPSDQSTDVSKDDHAKIIRKLNEMETKLNDISEGKCKSKNKPDALNADQGGVYVRWGGDTCGNSKASTELVYAGQVAGSHYKDPGAAVNYLCMPKKTIWSNYDSKTNPDAFVYGAEIHTYKINVHGTPWEASKYDAKGVSCAVCKTKKRTSVIMIPGRNRCFPGWIREYHGYLAAGHPKHAAGTEYVCLDEQPVIYPTTSAHVWQKIFFSVEASCHGALNCPPYVNGRELTCVVCSK